jgi:hypothetical protein
MQRLQMAWSWAFFLTRSDSPRPSYSALKFFRKFGVEMRWICLQSTRILSKTLIRILNA